MKNDIKKIDDIRQLVDIFCIKEREDKLLAPKFYNKIKYCWTRQLEKMYYFRQIVHSYGYFYYTRMKTLKVVNLSIFGILLFKTPQYDQRENH